MSQRQLKPSAIYLLPNLLTTGNLFFGFAALVYALEKKFVPAAESILLASIFDILDGRVARLTGTSSAFGTQYDSLCDLVSFGLAPSLLLYQHSLHSLGRLGWCLSFIYMGCGALRLARFNVQSSLGKTSGDFSGLPIPMSACLIATFVALSEGMGMKGLEDSWLWHIQSMFAFPPLVLGVSAILAPMLAGLMVSNLPYRSHKTLITRRANPFRFLALTVILVGLAAYSPSFTGFLCLLAYSVSGILEWVLGWKKSRDDSDWCDELDSEENHGNEPPSSSWLPVLLFASLGAGAGFPSSLRGAELYQETLLEVFHPTWGETMKYYAPAYGHKNHLGARLGWNGTVERWGLILGTGVRAGFYQAQGLTYVDPSQENPRPEDLQTTSSATRWSLVPFQYVALAGFQVGDQKWLRGLGWLGGEEAYFEEIRDEASQERPYMNKGWNGSTILGFSLAIRIDLLDLVASNSLHTMSVGSIHLAPFWETILHSSSPKTLITRKNISPPYPDRQQMGISLIFGQI